MSNRSLISTYKVVLVGDTGVVSSIATQFATLNFRISGINNWSSIFFKIN